MYVYIYMRDIFVVEIFQTFGELHGTCTRLRAGPGISGDTGDLRDLPSGNETWLPNYWEHAGKMMGKWWQIDGKMMGKWWENDGKMVANCGENDGKMLGNMTHHLEIEVYSWEFHQKVVDFSTTPFDCRSLCNNWGWFWPSTMHPNHGDMVFLFLFTNS